MNTSKLLYINSSLIMLYIITFSCYILTHIYRSSPFASNQQNQSFKHKNVQQLVIDQHTGTQYQCMHLLNRMHAVKS